MSMLVDELSKPTLLSGDSNILAGVLSGSNTLRGVPSCLHWAGASNLLRGVLPVLYCPLRINLKQ